ncbi:hypothetical protein R4Y45_06000 [Holzapfeliella sp. He02]|uniref:Uncharacterized protein n=1 Tax=Holzapfeliella saturejae TaxID=3082953 RepID=A0ABU8SIL6_9LACO
MDQLQKIEEQEKKLRQKKKQLFEKEQAKIGRQFMKSVKLKTTDFDKAKSRLEEGFLISKDNYKKLVYLANEIYQDYDGNLQTKNSEELLKILATFRTKK